MSVVGSASELRENRQETREDTITVTRTWQVTVDSLSDGGNVVELATGIPSFGAEHPTQSGLFVNSITSERAQENGLVWTVTANYQGYRTGGIWGDEEKVPPLDARPLVVRMTQKSQEAIDTDVNGSVITNSSGEDYDPPLTADRSKLVYQITRYVYDPRDDIYDAYMDSVNSDWWRPYTSNVTYPPWTAKIDDINCELVHIQQYSVFRETWTIVIFRGMPNSDAPGGLWGHQVRAADRGKRAWQITNDEWWFGPIKDESGDPVTEPVALNGQAGILEVDQNDVINGTGTVWRLHQVYKALPFGYLNLE